LVGDGKIRTYPISLVSIEIKSPSGVRHPHLDLKRYHVSFHNLNKQTHFPLIIHLKLPPIPNLHTSKTNLPKIDISEFLLLPLSLSADAHEILPINYQAYLSDTFYTSSVSTI